MKVLVDTNVFLDILLKRNELMNESIKTLELLRSNNDQIYINAASLKDIYYFASKSFHSSYKARLYINDIYSRVSKVISFSSDDAIEAIYEDGDFEDNCLVESAKASMCDAIITRNVKGFIGKDIPVFSPKEFLKIR